MKTIKTYDDNLKPDGFFFQLPDKQIVWVATKHCFLLGGKHSRELSRLNVIQEEVDFFLDQKIITS